MARQLPTRIHGTTLRDKLNIQIIVDVQHQDLSKTETKDFSPVHYPQFG